MEDRSGQSPTSEDVASAARVVQKFMIKDIMNLPPELAVEMPNILRCLRELDRRMK